MKPGEYLTRDGHTATVVRTDSRSYSDRYPVEGVLDGRIAFWTVGGAFYSDMVSPEDLVERIGNSTPLPEDLDQVERAARELVAWAAGLGAVVTIDAAGVVSVREAQS